MKTAYCTIFDINYLAKALVLYKSFTKVNSTGLFAFYCIDSESKNLIKKLNLPRSIVVGHDDFATEDLVKLKNIRSQAEYCWTCKPIALLNLMKAVSEATWVVYVDTDMMFFANPDLVLREENAHYLLTPHRFHPNFSRHEKIAGKFNAGYFAARNNEKGAQVVTGWKDQCLASCDVVPTENTYADQKYLNFLAALFPFGGTSVAKGLNAAPWNIDNYEISMLDGRVQLDEESLILYHYQGLQLFDDGTASIYMGDQKIVEDAKLYIYSKYIKEIKSAYDSIRNIELGFKAGVGNKAMRRGRIIGPILNYFRVRRNLVPFNL